MNLLPEKGLGRRKSSHLPLPSPTWQSWGGRSSPCRRRETGRDCVPEGLAVPREAQWWGEFPVRKRRALHSGHVLAWQTCHFQGGNFVSGFFFFAVRTGEGQEMDGNEELVAPTVLLPPPLSLLSCRRSPLGLGPQWPTHRPPPGCQTGGDFLRVIATFSPSVFAAVGCPGFILSLSTPPGG